MCMKVDKIITPAVRDIPELSLKKTQKVIENPIREFNDRAGDLAGRTKVMIGSAKEITEQELAKIKNNLRKKMTERNFSPNVIDTILWATEKKSAKLSEIMVNDEYAHSQDIKDILASLWNIERHFKADGTPKYIVDYALLENAARKKNYTVCKEICDDYFFDRTHRITRSEQIEDMTSEVMKRSKYEPVKANIPAVSKNELKKQTDEIVNLLKRKKGWSSGDAYQFSHFINSENVELMKVLAEDSKAELGFIKFASTWCNAENAELMLRAALNKDYQGLCYIAGYSHVTERAGMGIATPGKIRIRKFDTIDARYAGFCRKNTLHNINKEQESFQVNPEYAGIHRNGATIKHEMNSSQKSFHDIVSEYCTDDVSSAAKVLLEDPIFDNDIAAKILQKMNVENAELFKKAILERDFATLEKLCGNKFTTTEIEQIKKEISNEIKNNSKSQAGKYTKADFVKYFDDKITPMKKLDVTTLKGAEVRNLAKLFGITEEQVLNMDKKLYRKLCIKFHPDRNQNDNLAKPTFRILNRVFCG